MSARNPSKPNYIGFSAQRKIKTLLRQEIQVTSTSKATGEIANYGNVKSSLSDRLSPQAELEQSLSLLRGTLESTADGIMVSQSWAKIAIFNQKFVEMWDIPDPIMESRDLNKIWPFILGKLKDPEGFFCQINDLLAQPEAEVYGIFELKDGRIFERYSLPQRIAGEIVGRVWSFRDITERKRAEEKIRYQALHDLLTGLPNRTLFDERLSVALAQAKRQGGKLAVCFLDLDRFKTINDTLGHAVGDRLLQCVAQRLSHCLRKGDTVSRWGGDEFTILLPKVTCQENVATVAQRILENFKSGFLLEERHLQVSTSIGIAVYPEDGEDAETLVKNADTALYAAKARGRNACQFFASPLTAKASEFLTLKNSLPRALEQEEFVVHYQPTVNAKTGQIIQMEALVRWQHPELGLIFPEKFIPLAEEKGLMEAINEWVLRTACTQNKAWQDAGFPKIGVAVNLSARQFQHPYLVEKVAHILKQTGLAPNWLEVEITESIAMQDDSLTERTVNNLHQLGVGIALDDFGTGYASLTNLTKFSFTTLKLDRSCVKEMAKKTNYAIMSAIITLANKLNIRVVAEGVETEEQRDLLQSIECEAMQGYLFSQPLSAEAAAERLAIAA